MKKFFQKCFVLIIALIMIFGAVACTKTGTDVSNNKITIMLKGWANKPIEDSNDPYKAYILENYGLDATLMSVDDFDNTAATTLASDNPPDIISFPTLTSMDDYYEQEVLIDDWTPYLDKMPHIKEFINAPGRELLKMRFTTPDGKLKAIYTYPEAANWGLKIRKDWLLKYDEINGTNFAETGPETDDDLLAIARYFRNGDPDGNGVKDTYAFTTAGNGASFGTMGTWVPLMYGSVSVEPHGAYINEAGEVSFGVLDGSHKQMLDFVKTMEDEDLIDPNWFTQTWADKVITKQGKVGIEWYTGAITQETQLYQDGLAEQNGTEPVNTLGWWETYPVPDGTDDGTGGKMAGGNAFNVKALSVSYKLASNPVLMDKVCAFLDAVWLRSDGSRSEAYDALRWGVGVEEGLEFQQIEGMEDVVYINKWVRDDLFWLTNAGAVDWGAWFSSTSDGVVQGDQEKPDEFTMKVAEHNRKASTYPSGVQIGSLLSVNAVMLNRLITMRDQYEIQYVKSSSDIKYKTYDDFVAAWKKTGGDEFLEIAEEQFRELGFLK